MLGFVHSHDYISCVSFDQLSVQGSEFVGNSAIFLFLWNCCMHIVLIILTIRVISNGHIEGSRFTFSEWIIGLFGTIVYESISNDRKCDIVSPNWGITNNIQHCIGHCDFELDN